MLTKVFKILRSSIRRSSEFYAEEEREDSTADMSLVGNSPDNRDIVSNIANCSGVDESLTNNPVGYDFTAVHPRPSIRMKEMHSENTLVRSKGKSTKGKPVTGENCKDKPNDVPAFDGSDSTIIDIGPRKGVGVKKISTAISIPFSREEKLCMHDEEPSILEIIKDHEMYTEEKDSKNQDSQSSPIGTPLRGRKELLCMDDEECSTLVIDENHAMHSVEKDGENQDSQSCHTSPVEVFDLCEPEPKRYIPRTSKKRKTGVKTKVKSNNGAPSQTLENTVISQSVLDDVIRSAAVDVNNTFGNCNSQKNTGKKVSEEMQETVQDFTIRLRLPVFLKKKKKNKKLFSLKVSQLLAPLSDETHPMYKWRDMITLENIRQLDVKDKRQMIKILTDFVEVEAIQIKL